MSLWTALTSLLSGIFGRSQSMPDAAELFGTPLSKEADEFLTSCNVEFNQKQEAFQERWLAGCDSYAADLERGILTLSRSGQPGIVCDVEVVGSFSSADDSWEWAWNNPNAPQPLIVPRDSLADIGHKYGLKYLLSGFVPVPNKKFPHFVSGIALKLRDALAVYEAQYEGLSIFLLLTNPREAET